MSWEEFKKRKENGLVAITNTANKVQTTNNSWENFKKRMESGTVTTTDTIQTMTGTTSTTKTTNTKKSTNPITALEELLSQVGSIANAKKEKKLKIEEENESTKKEIKNKLANGETTVEEMLSNGELTSENIEEMLSSGEITSEDIEKLLSNNIKYQNDNNKITQIANNKVEYENKNESEKNVVKKAADNLTKTPETFKDGYDFGDVTKTILGTTGDIGMSLLEGAVKVGEGAGKLLAGGVAQVAEWAGNDDLSEKIRNNLATKEAPISEKINEAQEIVDKNSVLGETSDAILEGVGYSTILGGTERLGGALLMNVLTFASSTGQSLSENYANETENAWKKAITSGSIETFTENLFGLFGKTGLDDKIANKLAQNCSTAIQKALVRQGVMMGSEASEEIISHTLNKLFTDGKIQELAEGDFEEFFSNWDWNEAVNSALIAGASAGISGVGTTAMNISQTKNEYNVNTKEALDIYERQVDLQGIADSSEKQIIQSEVSRLSEAEKKKVLQESETQNRIKQAEQEQNIKLSTNQKETIAKEVVEDIKNGTIDTSNIELDKDIIKKLNKDVKNNLKEGNISLERIQEILSESNDKTTQINNLQQEINTLTNEQSKQEAYNKLQDLIKEREEDILSIISKNKTLSNIAEDNSNRFKEIYHEETGNKYEDDVYNSAKAIHLNNTKLSNATVNLVAKLANDTQTNYKFTNNEQLKSMKYDFEEKTVNGLVRTNNNGETTILINIDSSKALETVIGHETTHLFEGTEEYQELQRIAKEYAELKGTYQEYYERISKVYDGIDNVNIENEVTSDIIGDYLFSDKEFINKMYIENRNLFRKVKDKIKSWIKKATSGSKEYKKLVELQNKFEEVYKAGKQSKSEGVEYHISSNLSQDIDKVLNGEYNSSEDVKLRDYTPEILVKNGIKDLPMLINQNHLKENILSGTKAKKMGIYRKDANYHNLGKETFMKAIDSLDNPLMIMKSISKNNSQNTYVIVTDVQNKNGEQIIVPIYLETKGNYNNLKIDTNKVKTVYAKNNIRNLVDNTIKSDVNNIIYMTTDKNKRSLLTSTGLQLSNSSNSTSNISIPNSNEKSNTNIKYSMQKEEKNAENKDIKYSLSNKNETDENVKYRHIVEEMLESTLENNIKINYNNNKESDIDGSRQKENRGSLATSTVTDNIRENAYTQRGFDEFEQRARKQESKNITKEESKLVDNYSSAIGKKIKLFDGDINDIPAFASKINKEEIYLNRTTLNDYDIDRLVYHEKLESEVRHNNEVKNIANNCIEIIMNDSSFLVQIEEFFKGKEKTTDNEYAIAKDILCDMYTQYKTGKILDYNNVLDLDTNMLINDTLENIEKILENSKKSSFSLSNKNETDENIPGTYKKDILMEQYKSVADLMEEMLEENLPDDIKEKNNEEKLNWKTKAKNYLSKSKTKFKNEIVDKFGTSIIANNNLLNNKIDKMRDIIVKNGQLTLQEKETFFDEIYDTLKKIDTTYYDTYKDLKQKIQSTKLYVPIKVRNDIGDFEQFRKANLRNAIMTSNETDNNIDSYYEKLSDRYPDLFPDDIVNQSEELKRIVEVSKDIAKVEMNVSAYNDKFMGANYRSWAKNEFMQLVDNYIKGVKKAVRYNKDLKPNQKIEVTREEARELYKKLPDAKRKYEKVLNKELLTNKDKLQVERLLNGEIEISDLNKEENLDGIIRVATAKSDYNSIKKSIDAYVKNIKNARLEQAKIDIGDLNAWKDKKLGFEYSRETPIRNIKDIAPKEVANTIIDKYFKSYIEVNEKKVVDTINDYNERIKQLDIGTSNKYKVEYGNETHKVSESALVQLLGEKKISVEDVKKAGADGNKIENAVKEFRKIYNELIEKTNESLIDSGYAPIEYRKDYFPHFTETEPDSVIGKVAKLIGIDITNKDELPTDISGKTYNFKPRKNVVF